MPGPPDGPPGGHEEALSAAWCDVVSRLGHELRTPLASAQMLGDLLGGELAPERRQRYAQQLAEVLSEQRRLLGEVVELSKVAAARSAPEPAEVDGGDLLAALADAVRDALADSPVVLSLPAPAALPSLVTDPRWVASVSRRLAEASVAAAAASLSVEVETGAGFAVCFLDDGEPPSVDPTELFRPFCRDRRTTTPSGSASLRLAIADWRCRSLGGSLSAATRGAERGLAMTLWLPG